MSLLDRITDCRRHDPAAYLPFRVGGVRYGRVRRAAAGALAAFPDTFEVGPAAVDLHPDLRDYDERTRAVRAVLPALRKDRWLGPDREEPYPVLHRLGERPLFEVDRSVVPFLGLKAFGVHVNAYVRSGADLRLWVARRSKDRQQSPGKLDHLVAGGQPLGLGLGENLRKECREEADVPAEIADRAVPAGSFSYVCDVPRGLRDDTLMVFDLELPADFRPRNNDGEAEAFFLWPLDRVTETLRRTDDFKYNVAPVVIGFLLRHGALRDEPDLDRIREALG